MTSVIPVPLRREIVTRHQAGETLSGIAQQLRLSVWGVRKIWRQYRDKGEAGLASAIGRVGAAGLAVSG